MLKLSIFLAPSYHISSYHISSYHISSYLLPNTTLVYGNGCKRSNEYQYTYRSERSALRERARHCASAKRLGVLALLDRVKSAEQGKLPVSDILILLGRNDKSPRKSSSTLEEANADNKVSESAKTNDEVLETSVKNPRKTKTPSKRRKQGYGGGYIECKPIKRGWKEYKQYWYHYEFWQEGDVVVKKSRYIPKRLVPKVERMNEEKVAVREILEVLGVKG